MSSHSKTNRTVLFTRTENKHSHKKALSQAFLILGIVYLQNFTHLSIELHFSQ